MQYTPTSSRASTLAPGRSSVPVVVVRGVNRTAMMTVMSQTTSSPPPFALPLPHHHDPLRRPSDANSTSSSSSPSPSSSYYYSGSSTSGYRTTRPKMSAKVGSGSEAGSRTGRMDATIYAQPQSQPASVPHPQVESRTATVNYPTTTTESDIDALQQSFVLLSTGDANNEGLRVPATSGGTSSRIRNLSSTSSATSTSTATSSSSGSSRVSSSSRGSSSGYSISDGGRHQREPSFQRRNDGRREEIKGKFEQEEDWEVVYPDE